MPKRYQLFVDEVIRRRKESSNAYYSRREKERDPNNFIHDDFMYMDTRVPGIAVSFQKFVRFFLSLDRLDLSHNWVWLTVMDLIIEEDIEFIKFLRDYATKKYSQSYTRRGNFFDLPSIRKGVLTKNKNPFRKIYNYRHPDVFYPNERKLKEIEEQLEKRKEVVNYLVGNIQQEDEVDDSFPTVYEDKVEDYLNFDELLKDFEEDEEVASLTLEDLEKADENDDADEEKDQ